MPRVDHFPILKDLIDNIDGDINQCAFLIFYNKVCHHKEDMLNLLNCLFSK